MSTILTAENLQNISTIKHGFYTRAWGNNGLFNQADLEQNLRNRSVIAANLGVEPAQFLSCKQIHCPDVVTVTKHWDMADRPTADAMVTRERGIALGILTADCVPLLLCDPAARVIGAAHAGWRGAIGGVIENTINAMENLGASRANIAAAIGPCIWNDSYEVGPEFPAPFLDENVTNSQFFRPAERTGHFMFNLPDYATHKLAMVGIASIAPSPADTCADERCFFSYRRNTLRGIKISESLISAIVLTA
jgi:hypothetical protein